MTNSKIIANMSGREVLDTLRGDTPVSRVHVILANAMAEAEQDAMQRRPLTPIERRRFELQAANRICVLFGVGLE